MSSRVRVLIIIEAAMALLLGYQIISNPATLVFGILGTLALCTAANMTRGRFLRTPLMLFGCIALVVTVFINPTVWWMLLIAVIAILASGRRSSKFAIFGKQFVIVRGHDDDGNRNATRRPWMGDLAIGESVFEWNDMNLSVLAGDTIVDLGNTILPKRENVIVIRKGYGKTRVLVPIGIGVELNHSAMIGEVSFDGKTSQLRNETIHLFSEDYDTAPRHLRIITSAIVGDLEVVPV